MTFMFEVYYRPPRHLAREKQMTEQVTQLGGRLDCWEDIDSCAAIDPPDNRY